MTSKHRTSEYKRNAPIIRKRVMSLHAVGEVVQCWRCRRVIHPGQPFDVGHLPGAEGSALSDLAAEHRHKTSHCIGNRSDGGARGAAITNNRRTPATRDTTSWRL